MKINAVSRIQGYKNNKLIQTQVNPENTNKNENYSSIYSKGMSGLCFGSVIPLKTSFAKEIAEQPKVLKNLIDKFLETPGKISGINIDLTKKQLDKTNAINIVASGSSKNAGEMAKSFIEDVTDIPVNIISASEFITSKPKLNKNDLMIFISQSGNTADTLGALRYSKEKELKTIAVTNNAESKIHNESDFALDIEAGVEKAVAATKTVTASVVSLFGIGMKLGEIKETFLPNSKKWNEYTEALKNVPEQLKGMIKDTSKIDNIAKEIANKENYYLLAKEPNLGAVNEGALKLTETTQKRVISGSSSEFMHGLFTSIKPEDFFLQVASGKTESPSSKLAIDNFIEIKRKRNVETSVLLKSENNKINNIDTIDIPNTLDEISPLFTTIRFQQLTDSITKRLGIDPDNGGGVLTKFRQNLTM